MTPRTYWKKGDRIVLQARVIYRHADGMEEDWTEHRTRGLTALAEDATCACEALRRSRALLGLLRTAATGRKSLSTEQIQVVLDDLIEDGYGDLSDGQSLMAFIKHMEELLDTAEALPAPPQATSGKARPALTLSK